MNQITRPVIPRRAGVKRRSWVRSPERERNHVHPWGGGSMTWLDHADWLANARRDQLVTGRIPTGANVGGSVVRPQGFEP